MKVVNSRNDLLVKKYKITSKEYDELCFKQATVCAICYRPSKGKRLSVDHCNATDIVRGLLCTNCNLGLGNFKDDPGLLENAISYLRAFEDKKQRLLTLIE